MKHLDLGKVFAQTALQSASSFEVIKIGQSQIDALIVTAMC